MSVADFPSPTTTEGARPARIDLTHEVPIRLEQVSKWYGSVIGVNQVSLEVRQGIVALLGPNGAGKSTLMKLMTGQLKANIGTVRVFGRSVRSPWARRRVGYCPDVDAFYEEMTGRQFVHAMLRLSGYRKSEAIDRGDRAIDVVGMKERADKRIRGGSKGMRQRIKLAQAIAHDPDLLILDEPLSGLDPVGRREFCDLFRQWADAGKAILLSSHVIEEVESLAEGIILIGNGRVLTQGTWTEVAGYLENLPQQIRVSGDDIRVIASRLAQFEGVQKIEFEGTRDCVLSTHDSASLCDRVGEIVRQEGFRIDRLRAETNWAETLFGYAQDS